MKNIQPLADMVLLELEEIKESAFNQTESGIFVPNQQKDPVKNPSKIEYHARILKIGKKAEKIAEEREFKVGDYIYYNQYNAMKFSDNVGSEIKTYIIIKPEDVWGKYEI